MHFSSPASAARFFSFQKEGTTIKKAILLLLAFALCFSLCACGENDTPAATEATAEAATTPTEEKTIPPTAGEPATEASQPTGEETEALYTPYIGEWVCSDGYYVILKEDGTIEYNDAEYTPEYMVYGDGVAAVVYDAPYTYQGGIETVTAKGCVFVWGLTDRFGEGVMVGDHDGRHFVLQVE